MLHEDKKDRAKEAVGPVGPLNNKEQKKHYQDLCLQPSTVHIHSYSRKYQNWLGWHSHPILFTGESRFTQFLLPGNDW